MALNFWLSTHWDQWIYSKNELIRLRAEDLKVYTEEEYAKFMIFWSNFIQRLVEDAVNYQHMKIRFMVTSTAIVFFKRILTRSNMKEICPFALCCVCILLSSKAEENGMVSMQKCGQQVQTVLKKYFNANFEMTPNLPYELEFLMVEVLDCCLVVFHPYRPLCQLLEDLNKDGTIREHAALEEQSWKVVNDSLRTDSCLLYPPHIIACACIIVGCSLMDKDHYLKNWLPELAIDLDQVYDCVKTITDMYAMWKNFVEKEQVQGLIDKLPVVEGDPLWDNIPSDSTPPASQYYMYSQTAGPSSSGSMMQTGPSNYGGYPSFYPGQ